MINEELNEKLEIMFEACSEILSLNQYDIYWKQDTCWSRGAAGEIKLQQDYLMHKVKINPHKHKDEHGLLETVLHESVHASLCGYDTFLEVALEGVKEKSSRKQLKRLYTHFDEQATVRMTRALTPFAWETYKLKLKEAGLELEDDSGDDEDEK